MARFREADYRTLVRRIEAGKLVPVISDQVTVQMLFDNEELIRAWAEDIDYPFDSSFNITRLAQYYGVGAGDYLAPKEEYLAFLKRHYRDSFEESQTDGDEATVNGNLRQMRLSELVGRLNQSIFEDEEKNPLSFLAKLPIKIFITTGYHNFLEESLIAAGKNPRVELCYWNQYRDAQDAASFEAVPETDYEEESGGQGPAINPLNRLRDEIAQRFSEDELRDLAFQLDLDFSALPGVGRKDKARELVLYLKRHGRLPGLAPILDELRPGVDWAELVGRENVTTDRASSNRAMPSLFDVEPNYAPSVDSPLVYHLFGLDSVPSSIVLTEDDFLDFLVSASADPRIVPRRIKSALASSSLVLLGYRPQDWDFRILFRGLIAAQKRTGKPKLNVAIQVSPAGDGPARDDDARDAEEYLQQYFANEEFKIYWGSPQEFVHDLARTWEERA